MASQPFGITVRYFAALREIIGSGTELIQTNAATVGELRQQLMALDAAHAQALGSVRAVRTAVNQVLCDDAAVLSAGCEVAFFPPVTGG
jgi:molybdopterin synthase sulfur carrier subunit